MHKSIRCVVIKPTGYSLKKDRYPVTYLLHGWSGSYASWLSDAPQLAEHADAYQMLIVCPDGGYDSWYLDSPVDSSVRYETHISREVVSYVDYYYHTKATREGRAIAGLSMGGHGAVFIAARHPEVFGAVGSMCGGLDLMPFIKNDWDLKGVLGSPVLQRKNWETHTALSQVPRLEAAKLSIIIDCGDRDFFLDVNRAMHQALLQSSVPHEYTERPGEHNDAYWSNAVDFQLLYFDKYFDKHKQ